MGLEVIFFFRSSKSISTLWIHSNLWPFFINLVNITNLEEFMDIPSINVHHPIEVPYLSHSQQPQAFKNSPKLLLDHLDLFIWDHMTELHQLTLQNTLFSRLKSNSS